uniref:Ycf54 n=1 Tax=Melanthalia intermedia TaxID=172989 RepID=A0A345UAH0_9FLOR|nr:hypothetical protein [Melanthalia intermedia]AXI97456.1 hypothetical protein [Melanthalia intermedia]
MHKYYFALASKNFLMNEEPVEEILRERTNHYRKNKKDVDFWLITGSDFNKWIDEENICKKISRPYAAIVSSDKKFISWLKLRIGFILIGNFKSESILQFYDQ